MAWRDGSELRVATLAEDLNSGPRTHFKRLTTACTSSSEVASLGITTHIA